MTKRVSTHDDTPLPIAVPHHIADPTGRIEYSDLFGDDEEDEDEIVRSPDNADDDEPAGDDEPPPPDDDDDEKR